MKLASFSNNGQSCHNTQAKQIEEWNSSLATWNGFRDEEFKAMENIS